MQMVQWVRASRALCFGFLLTFALEFGEQAALAKGRITVSSLDGVWRITKVVVPSGPSAGADTHPQPGLQIFYRGYFSIVRDTSSAPRSASPPPGDPANLTDAEKIARYNEWVPFGASAGSYELVGDTLITHNLVAKQVRGMNLTEEATIRFEGRDTFVATATSEPGVPAGRQTTYTRVR
jgi:hypothetical protein